MKEQKFKPLLFKHAYIFDQYNIIFMIHIELSLIQM